MVTFVWTAAQWFICRSIYFILLFVQPPWLRWTVWWLCLAGASQETTSVINMLHIIPASVLQFCRKCSLPTAQKRRFNNLKAASAASCKTQSRFLHSSCFVCLWFVFILPWGDDRRIELQHDKVSVSWAAGWSEFIRQTQSCVLWAFRRRLCERGRASSSFKWRLILISSQQAV